MATNLYRSVTKINDDKHNNLMERKRGIVLKTDMLLEQTKKSAKNIGYLIKGFWPDNQEKFYTVENKVRASKSDIKRLTDAYDKLEDLKKEIREMQIHLEGDFNKSQPKSESDDEKDNMTSLAKNLSLKINVMMAQLDEFKLPNKI